MSENDSSSCVSCVSIGPQLAMKALYGALAMGADSAVLLCGRGFAGSDMLATACALARGIQHMASGGIGQSEVEQGTIGRGSIILRGERAVDGETGRLAPWSQRLWGAGGDVCQGHTV